ncbi:aldolase [Actinomyces sp. MRS3W]|uniref:class II aldolase/adducin family protein n=1 Tax=Actinomyces sp. MRS3W TaxID=2800796 RepID=UPI0028FD0CD0|nr:aldolase [Actinomyces sp. MRS3W]MDU0347846.1 aldolase [Actinomyces sp. MRS3W]
MTDEQAAREQLIDVARQISAKQLTHGRTGNVSVRVDDGILVTPTGSSLATITAAELSVIDERGRHVRGPKPSKEAFLHAEVMRARPDVGAVIHTHSTYCVAFACRADVNPEDVIPPLTAYYCMRVGRLPLLSYHAPGDPSLAPLVAATAKDHPAFLLANHGPVVAGANLGSALDAVEELEATAKVALLLENLPTRPLTEAQRADLARRGR